MIRIENLSVGYGRHAVQSGLDMEIPTGKLVAMIGRNGCGKSTLMRTMAGLQPALAGDVFYSGQSIASEQQAWKSLAAMSPDEKSRTIAFVNTEKIRIPGFRCRDLVALGRAPYTDWAGNLSDKDEDAVDAALTLVGMADFTDRLMDRMSDGECQNVMIARAIAQDTQVMLLDEPTAYLDYPNRLRTVRLLKCLASERGKTVIYSTHDLDLALEQSDSVLLVDSHGIVLLSPDSSELNARLSAAFGDTVSVYPFAKDTHINS